MALSCFCSKLAVSSPFPFWMIMCLLCSMHNTLPFPHIFSVHYSGTIIILSPLVTVKDLVYLKAVKYFFLLFSWKKKKSKKKKSKRGFCRLCVLLSCVVRLGFKIQNRNITCRIFTSLLFY